MILEFGFVIELTHQKVMRSRSQSVMLNPGRGRKASTSGHHQTEFGSGYSETNLKGMRTFYLAYPDLIHTPQNRHPLGDEFLSSMIGKRNAPFAPGGISSNLSWRNYRNLMRIDTRDARSFYEIETVKNSWP